jgi:hypothetical protein
MPKSGAGIPEDDDPDALAPFVVPENEDDRAALFDAALRLAVGDDV